MHFIFVVVSVFFVFLFLFFVPFFNSRLSEPITFFFVRLLPISERERRQTRTAGSPEKAKYRREKARSHWPIVRLTDFSWCTLGNYLPPSQSSKRGTLGKEPWRWSRCDNDVTRCERIVTNRMITMHFCLTHLVASWSIAWCRIAHADKKMFSETIYLYLVTFSLLRSISIGFFTYILV